MTSNKQNKSNKGIKNTSKTKGNTYERKMARELSTWIFGDKKILYKHEDSGARKTVYSGDIVPKDADNFHWTMWPFVWELKHGYKDNIPTLMNQNLVRKWLTKLLDERTDSQRIPMLLCQFHRQKAILLTNVYLNAETGLQLALKYKDGYEMFQVYIYSEIIKQSFYELMPDWFPEIIGLKLGEDMYCPKKPSESSKISNKPSRKKVTMNVQIGEIIDDILL